MAASTARVELRNAAHGEESLALIRKKVRYDSQSVFDCGPA